MAGIIAYGAYLPYHRLERADISAALGTGGGKGARTVASYDEDSTSMGVEAARIAVDAPAIRERVDQLYLATATPAYLDKTNATAVHAALALDPHVLAVDMVGSVRSGAGALITAARAAGPTLAVLSDIRTGLPGGADERDGGDGAAAFVFGAHHEDTPVLAEVLAQDTISDEVLDRWRLPGANASRVWEERFGEEVYVPAATEALAGALESTGLTADRIDHLVVAGLHGRACRAVGKAAGVRPEAVVPDLADKIGNAGTAQPGILLADVLDRCRPGETIALVVLGDGAAVLVLRATEALPARRPPRPVAAQIAAHGPALKYATYLTWRGLLDREPPRRPDPEPPYAPPSHRRIGWKYALVASRCTACGTRQMPPGRVCVACRSVDATTDEPVANVQGTVANSTVDRLAFTPSPPMLVVVVDFDGGGRLRCQLTDAHEADTAVGTRVEMTFRRTLTANGVHNYFWKARPVRTAVPDQA
ncbi:OB-fold domain-containing protein [Yinghuangia sp. ASG 101]|uniref:OB-fold domain-containing protein n=1 Tax=Yinghuangia sp. ASG 101 TaxID=2896848 RepID=UPI001E28A9B2|nr:OB-fold domain-containing protein [Yinghuangia sp. ASG 101]UGQ11222.1 OB-fold domain-containing protein [Yinghuangia sp. ASG 101]